jgi:Protein of unknown function (DUF2961)
VSYGEYGSSLRDLPRLRNSRRRRVSSWDTTGGNDDRLTIRPGETAVLADLAGPGSINHIWFTIAVDGPEGSEPDYLRKLVLRITWDDAEHPSVLVPVGDFFGVGHGKTVNFSSAPLQMSPQDGKGFNSFFHMPFASRAKVEIISELSEFNVFFYYYIDYETFDGVPEGVGYFHASWHRQNPTDGVEQGDQSQDEYMFGGTNLDGAGNYVILDAEGKGHYVGCVVSIRNLRMGDAWNWYGEGDDMIFIDGEPFPPSLHGTGTEDYFNTSWCPSESYSSPYHGITLPGGPNWSGEISLYRFHIEDPITFDSSIRVTIEHGHANKRNDDWSSVAYWYQTLPHRPLELLPVEQRLPEA